MPNSKHIMGRIVSLPGKALWMALYFITLGFSHKYRRRLRDFERLDPCFAVEEYELMLDEKTPRAKFEPHSQPPTYLGIPYQVKKYEPASSTNYTGELTFDRASVITATSAAALAIPALAGPGSYWVINTCFCAALGVSLEGLILVFYITIMASGTSDETIGRLARGKIKLLGNISISAKLPALVMTLPVVFATYSSLFLLIGCAVMVMMNPVRTQDTLSNPYYYLPIVPIGFGFICGCSAVFLCEVTTYREEQIRIKRKDHWAGVRRRIAEHAPPFGRKPITEDRVIRVWRAPGTLRQRRG